MDASRERERGRADAVRVVGGRLHRCPFCHEGIDAEAADGVACAGCLARHHGACWDEAHACSACGSARKFVVEGQPEEDEEEDEEVTQPPAARRAEVLQAILFLGAAGAAFVDLSVVLGLCALSIVVGTGAVWLTRGAGAVILSIVKWFLAITVALVAAGVLHDGNPLVAAALLVVAGLFHLVPPSSRA